MSENLQKVEATWAEVGRKARPLRKMVFVRTELRPEKDGLIYLPPSQRTNYAGLGHKVFMYGLVLSVGPDCKYLKPGDRVAFTRLFFAHWEKLEDGTLVGWLDETNVSALAKGPSEN